MKEIVDFIAGLVDGLGTVFAGHPFDTLKVRLQTSKVIINDFTSTRDCFIKTLQREGIFGLYKGVIPPLLMTPLFAKSALFGVYGHCRNFFQAQNRKNTNESFSDNRLIKFKLQYQERSQV